MKHKRKWKKSWKKKRVRKHLLPTNRCVHLNDKFPDSNFHHMSYNIGVYIPVELHRHIEHSLKSGRGMVEMNILALQYIYGELGRG